MFYYCKSPVMTFSIDFYFVLNKVYARIGYSQLICRNEALLK